MSERKFISDEEWERRFDEEVEAQRILVLCYTLRAFNYSLHSKCQSVDNHFQK